LLTAVDACGIEGTTDDLVTNTRKVFDTATAYEHDRVLLEVVAFPRDVGGDFGTGRESYTSDLAERGVRLLRRHGVDAGADAAALRRSCETNGLRFLLLRRPALSDQLLYGRHVGTVSLFSMHPSPMSSELGF
jgi:hypothetical protein